MAVSRVERNKGYTAKKYGIDFAPKKDSTETPAPLPCILQGQGRGRADRRFQGVFRKEAVETVGTVEIVENNTGGEVG